MAKKIQPVESEQTYANADGTIPEKKIPSVTASYALYRKWCDKADRLAYDRAMIASQVAGNAPFLRSEKEEMNAGWEANVNFRRTGNGVRKVATALWNMFVEAVHHMVEMSQVKKLDDDPNDYSMLMASAIVKTITKRWRNFPMFLINRFVQMVTYGNGPAFWPDAYSWKSRWLHVANVIVDDTAQCSVEDQDIVYVRDEIAVGKLYDKIKKQNEDDDTAELAGWNRNACIKAIGKFADDNKGGDDAFYISRYESEQAAVKTKGDASNILLSKMRIVHELEKNDATGKVAHRIFYEQDEINEYLYEDNEEYESFYQVLSFMFYDCGDGLYKGSRGYGAEVFAQNELFDRIMNSTVNGVYLSSGVLLESQSPDTDAKGVSLRKGGSVTVIPSTVKISSGRFEPNVNSLVGVADRIISIQNENLGAYNSQRVEDGRAVEKTRYEVRTQNANESAFRTDQSAWYFVQHDWWLQETIRRLMNPDYPEWADGFEDHQYFVKECERLGIPKELIDIDAWDVTATKAIGGGNHAMRLDYTDDMLSKAAFLDERGLNYVLRQWFAARMPWANVDKVIQSIDRIKPSEEDTQEASNENNFMMLGLNAKVSDTDIDVLHVNEHINGANAVAEKANGGQMQPAAAAMSIQLFASHIADHNKRISKIEARATLAKAVDGFVKKLIALSKKYANAAQQQAEQQQQQAQQQQRAIAEMQAKSSDVQLKHELELERVKLEDEREKIKIQLHNRRMTDKQEKQLDIKIRDTISKMVREDALVTAQIRNMDKKGERK